MNMIETEIEGEMENQTCCASCLKSYPTILGLSLVASVVPKQCNTCFRKLFAARVGKPTFVVRERRHIGRQSFSMLDCCDTLALSKCSVDTSS